GLAPAAYHAASLLVHAAMAAAVYLLALRLLAPEAGGSRRSMDARIAAGVFAALLYSLHPLQVEAVHVAAYLIDTPACLLALSSLTAYLSWASPGRRERLVLSWVLFLASAFWRWEGVALPAVLLALNVYPLRRPKERPRLWLELTPFAAISAGILFIQSYA